MTDERHQDLPSTKRRRLIVWAVLRCLLIAAVLVVLYYVLPLDRPWDSDTAVRLLIGLLAVAAVVVWGVKIITGSRYPGLRAAEARALILPFFLLLFASTYFVLERNSAASFTEPLTRTDALYFTVTVFTTVGFGDITAKSETARILLIIQMLADLALLGAGIRVLLGAVQRSRERRSPATTPARPPAPRHSELPGRSGSSGLTALDQTDHKAACSEQSSGPGEPTTPKPGIPLR